MKYLFSKLPCKVCGNENFVLQANVAYVVESIENCFVFGKNVFYQPLEENVNITKTTNGVDEFYYLFPATISTGFSFEVCVNVNKLWITVSNHLVIIADGKEILNEEILNLKYVNYEVVEGCVCLYFENERKYIVVVKNNKLCFASFYDEINVKTNQIYFLKHCNDFLNHGIVYLVGKTVETYTVYLDELDLNLQTDFVMFAFLDCLLAKNNNYCKNLLDESLNVSSSEIVEYFESFDNYFIINSTQCLLTKKNTLVGIYKFEIKNNKILNIIRF